jgi:hypothetical protein
VRPRKKPTPTTGFETGAEKALQDREILFARFVPPE